MIKIKRIASIYIDFIVNVIITTLLVNILLFGQFNLSAFIVVKIIGCVLYLILLYLMMILKDLLFRNGSLGKKIFGIGIFFTNGEIPNRDVLIKRNIENLDLLFPLNILSIIISNSTEGDKKYNTVVCSKKEFTN